MNKKLLNVKKIIAVCCLMLFSSIEIVHAAPNGYHDFSFFMRGYGGTDKSISYEKTSTRDSASVAIYDIATSASPNLKLTMRIREYDSNAAATNAMQFEKTEEHSFQLSYNKPYGVKGNVYYLKMQTHSKAKQEAWVSGIFTL